MPVSRVTFLSEDEALRLSPVPQTALISITNPGDDAPLPTGWKTLLRVRVADASYDEGTIASYGRMWPHSSHGFPTKAHALAIRSFLDNLPSHITELVIHCGAGVSRSGAVAKYAAVRYGTPFPENYDRHNEALYRLLQDPTVFDEALARIPQTQSAKSFWRRLLG